MHGICQKLERGKYVFFFFNFIYLLIFNNRYYLLIYFIHSDDDVVDLMEGFAEEYLADTGFFHSGPEAWINVLKREEKYV